MRIASAVVAAAMLVALASGARAHGDWPPKHGGIMNDGETSFELVAKGRSIVLYVEDHGRPVPTQGATGTLTLDRAARSWTVPVRAAGANRLECSLPVALASKDRVLVKVSLGDGSIVAARYVIK